MIFLRSGCGVLLRSGYSALLTQQNVVFFKSFRDVLLRPEYSELCT